MIGKMISTPRTVISIRELRASAESSDVEALGAELNAKVRKLFRGSLAIREVDAGSTNAEEEELKAISNAYYDVERFGVHFVASPRHADMLMVTGPITKNMAKALKETYDATPSPKIIVAVGDGAIDGGMFKDAYGVVGGASAVIPVDYGIPGDPPTPKMIIAALVKILEDVDHPIKQHTETV